MKKRVYKQEERSDLDLLERLQFVLDNGFQRVTYTEAIDILKKQQAKQKEKFKFPIESWGADLQSEHESDILVEKHFQSR
jgi:asparaginyl-tRNA synthetase